MEACASAHYWGREIGKLGHKVKLMPLVYVKPYVKRQKNDTADAEAICEAASRPTMRFVAVKTQAQQARGNRQVKYTSENLIPMFRKAALMRNEMIECGFTDNGGAIHSAERIMDILGTRLNYPGLNHINYLRNYPGAEFSVAALEAHKRGEKVLVEHVSPLRDFTRRAIAEISNGISDKEFIDYVKKHYRLVLLTTEETKRLNKMNRSKMKKIVLKKLVLRLRNSLLDEMLL